MVRTTIVSFVTCSTFAGRGRPPWRGRMPVPRRSPVKPRRRSPGSGCSGPFSDSRPAKYRLLEPYRSDFLGDYGETAERVRTERRADLDICRIAPARDQNPTDARDVVACIKGVPAAFEIGFEPG